jgi:hypothetical protein
VHRSHLMRKMKARSLPELSRMADRLNLATESLCVPKTSSELIVRLRMLWDKPRSVGAEALAHIGWQQGHGTGL